MTARSVIVIGGGLSGRLASEALLRSGAFRITTIERDPRRQRQDEPVRVVTGECVALREHEGGVEATLADGTSVIGHLAVLAVGRGDQTEEVPLDPEAAVLLHGPEHRVAAQAAKLLAAGHRGPLTMMSPTGRLPHAHKPYQPIGIDAADVPFGTSLRYFVRWLRRLAADLAGDGGDWRAAIDAVQPFEDRIWQHWTLASRRQFLVHVLPLWRLHRHRLAPEVRDRLRQAVGRGHATLLAGRVLVPRAGTVAWRPRGAAATAHLHAAATIDCDDVAGEAAITSNPLLSFLVASGGARADALGLGLEVDPDLALLRADGRPSPRLYAVGALTRGSFFELSGEDAVRRQCVRLAERLRSAAAAGTSQAPLNEPGSVSRDGGGK